MQRRYQPPAVDSSRVVQRPRPQVEDARTFQIGQIRRRFNPEVSGHDAKDSFKFRLTPSDPDFPFEIESLECLLDVPKTYPETGPPSLKVLNKEIPRGFQVNIERGFDVIRAGTPHATLTLLALINRLDKELETILAGEMAETIKIVAHRPSRPTISPKRTTHSQPAPKAHVPQLPIFAPEQKATAKAERQTNVRQLEARFGRLQPFAKSSDGFTYTMPLDSPRRAAWPSSLQTLRSFMLLVPELYPLEPCAIILDSDSKEARNVEDAFKQRASSGADATLSQSINHLTVNIKHMSEQPPISASRDGEQIAADMPVHQTPPVTKVEPNASSLPHYDDDKPHVHVIPRPPEWSQGPGEHDSDEDDSETDGSASYDTGDDTEDANEHPAHDNPAGSAPAERGILLSFPQLELHGIELLELTSLDITLKCERCKDTMDVERLRSNTGENASSLRDERCKKCASGLVVGFRADLMHTNSVRAGYLDLDGCTVVDMLPR